MPEIHEHDGGLSVRVGDIEGVQTIFAVIRDGRPHRCGGIRALGERPIRGAASRRAQPRTAATAEMNTRVLLKLMHEIRSAARRTHGVDRIELVYKDRHAGASARLNP